VKDRDKLGRKPHEKPQQHTSLKLSSFPGPQGLWLAHSQREHFLAVSRTPSSPSLWTTTICEPAAGDSNSRRYMLNMRSEEQNTVFIHM